MREGFNGIPFMYDQINLYNGNIDPSTVHTDSALKYYFMKYLIEKIFSIYEFKNIPEDWNMSYFNYVLFCLGFIGIMETDKFGVICQHGTLSGRGLYYQPTQFLVNNPIFDQSYNLRIDQECSIIKLQPNFSGVMDIVSFYADMLALNAESAGINLVNTKLAYVYMVDDDRQAESFKKMHDQITVGNPAVFADKKLFNEDGSPRWVLFNQNLQQNYIAGDILMDMAKWIDMFNSDIGIPNANTEKKERMLTDEINANNIDTISKASIWLECLKDGIDKTNKLFGTNISVDFRFDLQPASMTEIGGLNNGNNVNNRSLQLQ